MLLLAGLRPGHIGLAALLLLTAPESFEQASALLHTLGVGA
ncbi:MAG: hypothetical protein ACRYG7_54660 [Janthinobacterium lividum]